MKLFSEYSEKEQAVLKSDICANADERHIDYFLSVCHAKNINPFSGLLYLQIRTSKGVKKAVVAATIDGARLAASRSGEYAGSDEPEYDKETGMPEWCKVTVWRMIEKERCAFTAKIRMAEWMPEGEAAYMWKKKPFHMLGKAAEAQALRKAFPDYVAGAGEDEKIETLETEEAPKVDTEASKEHMLRFTNAVQAFSSLNVSEADLFEELGIKDKTEITEKHLEFLENLYVEMKAKNGK